MKPCIGLDIFHFRACRTWIFNIYLFTLNVIMLIHGNGNRIYGFLGNLLAKTMLIRLLHFDKKSRMSHIQRISIHCPTFLFISFSLWNFKQTFTVSGWWSLLVSFQHILMSQYYTSEPTCLLNFDRVRHILACNTTLQSPMLIHYPSVL